MANLASEASDQVLNFLKTTGLDFKIVETPFSVEIQIKKKFIKYNQRHLSSKVRGCSSQLQPETIPDSSSNLKQFSNIPSKLQPKVSAPSSFISSIKDTKAKDMQVIPTTYPDKNTFLSQALVNPNSYQITFPSSNEQQDLVKHTQNISSYEQQDLFNSP